MAVILGFYSAKKLYTLQLDCCINETMVTIYLYYYIQTET